jgi:hypothetical protein
MVYAAAENDAASETLRIIRNVLLSLGVAGPACDDEEKSRSLRLGRMPCLNRTLDMITNDFLAESQNPDFTSPRILIGVRVEGFIRRNQFNGLDQKAPESLWRASLDKIICLPNLGFVLENVAFVLDLVILGL